MLTQRIGFIGAGQMATALAQGFVRTGLVTPEAILAADPLPEARQRFGKTIGAKTCADNAQIAAQQDVVFLAIKPQQMSKVLNDLRGRMTPKNLVVSIAAGVRLATIAEGLSCPGLPLIRVMPNTPCLVGHGASAFCLGEHATQEQGRLIKQLLEAVGLACQVDE